MKRAGGSNFLMSVCRVVFPALLLLLAASCGGGGEGSGDGSVDGPVAASPGPEIPASRELQGGDTTVFDRTTLAFENPSPNLSDEELSRHFDGDKAFSDVFVSPPATLNPGLGPVFNNSSCNGCHTKNGRGQPVFDRAGLGSQALIRVSIDSGVEEVPGGPPAVPGLGTQIQDHAVFGVSPEAEITLTWKFLAGRYKDGTKYELRRPQLEIKLADGTLLPSDVRTSMRVAPPVFGLGLLEAVSDAEIQSHADPEDLDRNGISGKANIVWDDLYATQRLGRFGRKASRSSVLLQSAGAYKGDMGIASPIFPDPDGSTEISGTTLADAEFYSLTLAVPAARDVTFPEVQQGASLFSAAGCSNCHLPTLTTGTHPVPGVSNQTIHPYTDLLLHDMGPGLADNRSDFLADGQEWRTPPLWGVGITATILSSTQNYLHDGRARTLEEAILWHGGEAEGAKQYFKNLSSAERSALIAFLRSL